MNRISTTRTRTRLQALSAALLVGLIALTGASWMTLVTPAETSEVLQFERVVISGKNTADATETIAQLPRVVVVGRRDPAADGAQVASACVAPAAC
ncbi:hypothetical protein [Roseateles sp.]|uniref:hypothetical protein n=1 Tax=Roseateles sp. TaxID=1971397 RepID=UPI003BAB0F4C